MTLVDPRRSTTAELAELQARLAAAATPLGFPAARDCAGITDLLAPLHRFLLNNCGDPHDDGAYALHTKRQEREAVGFLADLLRLPADDRWGYVTSGASEGEEHGLWLARRKFDTGVVYLSAASHHSIFNALDRLRMRHVVIRTDHHDEIDYHDLSTQVGQRRDRPAIVVACVGSMLTESVDDVRRIVDVLNALGVRRRWIHADAALSGIPLALLDPAARPGFDFADGADSIVVSGHKFLGGDTPYGVFLTRDSNRVRPKRTRTYTGSVDSPLSNSRSGLAALRLWLTLRVHGVPGLTARAQHARDLAVYTCDRLHRIGWPATRLPHAFTVVLPAPPDTVARRWSLPTHRGRTHIVCMPGVTRTDIDALVRDLAAVQGPRTEAGATTRGLLVAVRS